jgi:ATP-binding cassette subfamily C (CFTR/MRP) protein 4
MFKGVIGSPMVFFESNPVGRILNRFTKDISTIDEFLPIALWDVLSISLFMIAIISVLGVMNPIALTSLILLIPAFYITRKK